MSTLKINISLEIFSLKWANENLSKHEFKTFRFLTKPGMQQPRNTEFFIHWFDEQLWNKKTRRSLSAKTKKTWNQLFQLICFKKYLYVLSVAYRFEGIACAYDVSVAAKKSEMLSAHHEHHCHLLHFNGVCIPMASKKPIIKWLKLIDHHFAEFTKECAKSEWPKRGHQIID